MVGRAHRFHGRNALRPVYQHGETVRSGPISLRYLHNPRRQNYRVAVVVSKKVNKSAVVRNRLRRRIYEIIRSRGRELRQSVDLVYIVYEDSPKGASHAALDSQIFSLLQRAGIIEATHTSPAMPPHLHSSA